jgi:hypothetical protein
MVYSDVVTSGLILPSKVTYTVRDVHKIIEKSLFNPVNGRTLTESDAVFIVKCSAVYHGTNYSKVVKNMGVIL